MTKAAALEFRIVFSLIPEKYYLMRYVISRITQNEGKNRHHNKTNTTPLIYIYKNLVRF